jgi:hypothetical protein
LDPDQSGHDPRGSGRAGKSECSSRCPRAH